MLLSWPLLIALAIPVCFLIANAFFASRDQPLYNLKQTRRLGSGFCDLLTYAALIRENTILNKDGSLLAAYEFRGQDPSTRAWPELVARVARLNAAMQQRDKGWMLHVDMIRTPAPPRSPAAYYATPEEQLLAQAHCAHTAQRYLTRYLLAVTYLPETNMLAKSSLYLEEDEQLQQSIEEDLETFEHGLRELEDELQSIMTLSRLGTNHQQPSSNDLLAALVTVIYGDVQPMIVGATPVFLTPLLGAQDLVGGVRPRIGDKHIGILNITSFPDSSYPGILECLQEVNASFRFSTRIIIEDQHRSRKKIDTCYRSWFGAQTSLIAKAMDGPIRINRHATHMADDAEQALSVLNEGKAHFCWYTAKIVLLCESVQELEGAKRAVRKAISTQEGFLLRDETINAIDAYLGSLWSDGYHDIRKYMLTTRNIGDLLLTFAPWKGREQITCEFCPPGIQPMAIVQIPGGSDFALDPHLRDMMHLLGIGTTSTGKTTLINFMMGNFRRTPTDQFIGLDFGYGMYTPCQFFDGDHIDPRGQHTSYRFSLFTHIEDASERAWVVEYLATLMELNGLVIHAPQREMLEETLIIFANTPAQYRSLSTFIPKVDDPGHVMTSILEQYTVKGQYEGILDGISDHYSNASLQVYELSNVIGGDTTERVIVPVIMALFHAITRKLKRNHRTFIAIDEAWSHFRSPIAQRHLDESLRTFRKLHAGVGLFTQNLNDIISSSLCMTVMNACKTRIFLPNPLAQTAFEQAYLQFGLRPTEIRKIATATPKREYYFSSEDGSAMIDLKLSRAELAIFARGSQDDLSEVRHLQAQYPQQWKYHLLQARGLADAAEHLKDLSQRYRFSQAQEFNLVKGAA